MAAPTARVSVTAEVVGTGSDGTEPSLLFSVQRHGVYSRDVTLLKRYLFNCGENTQRLCGENGAKLSTLDSIFFTRFDVQSVSGVPGMIFSLSTCGAASLRLHGPTGLETFLTAIQSFVRRKYPRITCVETAADRDDNQQQQQQQRAASAQSAAAPFDYETWHATEDQRDQHMRIAAVTLRANATSDKPHRCLLCERGDAAPVAPSPPPLQPSLPTSIRRNKDPDARFRAWLVRFCTAKVSAKLPFVDVLMSRHRGRLDDLRTQLEAKYGVLEQHDSDASSAEASSDSADSSSDDSDDSDEVAPETQDALDLSTRAFSRKWLVQFYRQHQPEKLAHVDRVLQQFRGREATLQTMLLAKYASTSNSTSDTVVLAPLPTKRRKLDVNAAVAAAASTVLVAPVASAAVASTTALDESDADPPTTFVELHADATASAAATAAPSSSLCYVLKFLHDVHAVVWIVDCRTREHIEDLTQQFARDPRCQHDDHVPVLLVHFSPVDVLLDVRYQSWMQTHATATTQQLVFDGTTLETAANGVFSWVFRASAQHTLELLQQQQQQQQQHAQPLWRSLATFLDDQQQRRTDSSTAISNQQQLCWRFGAETDAAAHVAQSQLRFKLPCFRDRPSDSRDSSRRATYDYTRTGWRLPQQQEASGTDALVAAPGSAPLMPQGVAAAAAATNALRLVILGTGSAAPSRLRGSTGIYLELTPGAASTTVLIANSPPAAMLIDCGEGTFGQLVRQFGATDAAARMRALRCVWISHSHADHQCGLVRVLLAFVQQQLQQLQQQSLQMQSLLVIAPQSVVAYAQSWLPHVYAACGVHAPATRAGLFTFVTCRAFNTLPPTHRVALLTQTFSGRIQSLVSVPVHHCYDAFGLVLQLESGAKIVYSGDTRPCNQLIAAGLDATLLIHEATFDDSMHDDAVKKKHCTVGEALDVARQMRAREVVLTHFSQRYPKLPPPLSLPTAAADGAASEVDESTSEEHGRAATNGSYPIVGVPTAAAARVHCAFDGFELFVAQQ